MAVSERPDQVPANHRFRMILPLAALAFAVVHLAFEHFTGGVKSHHLLNRADLPAFSNWLGLVTLPLLGIALALRVSRLPPVTGWAGFPAAVLVGLFGAFLYGAVLATSFELGAMSITSAVFFGLFLCALLFPVYRAEYLLGFVAGMTVTFGAILPFFIALVFATISFVVRFLVGSVVAALRKRRAPDGAV